MKESNKQRKERATACKAKIAEIQAHNLSDDQLTRIIGSVVVFLVVLAII